ncbi:MAG: hypothetical protein M1833_006690 [Piccolia ochrophora]|nr:MAG: hypothetical protein M1833_006690 [Piccolia ochrophora]
MADNPDPPPPPPSSAPETPSSQQITTPSAAPPIITYPEFLTSRPATTLRPLLTLPHLLSTIYLLLGSTAALHLTNTHLLAPLLASQTRARHDFFATALSSLSTLIAKLETRVSSLPTKLALPAHVPAPNYEDEDDEDPTELFHVDVGTQTSAPPSPTLQTGGSSTPTSVAQPPTPLVAQTERLAVLQSHVSELVSQEKDIGDADVTTAVGMDELKGYLEGLVAKRAEVGGYTSPYYGVVGGGLGGAGAGKGRGDGDDEMEKVKAGIRGVKGVLLSARSFPAGAGRR